MKKFLFAMLACFFALFTGCSKEDQGDKITVPDESQLAQTAYADEDDTGSGFTFTASSAWTAEVNETTPAAAALRTRAGNASWLKLLYNGTEKYSGTAGTFTLVVELEPNFSGSNRSARIDIRSGNAKISVSVTQYAETETGEKPTDPNPVTAIRLDKTEMLLKTGGKGTLKAAVVPENATVKTVIWSSSDPGVATVSANGEVTAVAEGEATVTAASPVYETVQASCKVTVTADGEAPKQKLVETVKYTGTGVDSYATTAFFTYDEQNRVKTLESNGYDGEGTTLNSTYSYAGDKITVESSYTNSEESGTSTDIIELGSDGLARTKTATYYMAGEPGEEAQVSKTVFRYADGFLSESTAESRFVTTNDQGVPEWVASTEHFSFTWDKDGNLSMVEYESYNNATPESKSKYRQTVRYDKTLSAGKANMNVNNIIGDIYMGDINTQTNAVFGKTSPNAVSEYLSYDYDENEQQYRLSEKIVYEYRTGDEGHITAVTARRYNQAGELTSTDTYNIDYR